jgi:predicted nucleotidyltransferase
MSQIDQIIEHVARRIMVVKGVRAIVLGGSRARGTHSAVSDIDIGLYYSPEEAIDRVELSKAAADLDDLRRDALASPIHGWGPWVNGGAWLTVDGVAVDLIYRDMARVEAVIDACRAGQIKSEQQAGHPFGFVSSIYFSEVATCRLIGDPDGGHRWPRRALARLPALDGVAHSPRSQ